MSDLKTYELTITLPFTSRDLSPETARLLEFVLNCDPESSRRFHAQLFYHGLYHCLEDAFKDARDIAMQDLYGDERVPNEDGIGYTARWFLEAEKGPLPSPYMCGAARVGMRQVDEE